LRIVVAQARLLVVVARGAESPFGKTPAAPLARPALC
jgi:hypothetical protein